jgi:hypothetical protein
MTNEDYTAHLARIDRAFEKIRTRSSGGGLAAGMLASLALGAGIFVAGMVAAKYLFQL